MGGTCLGLAVTALSLGLLGCGEKSGAVPIPAEPIGPTAPAGPGTPPAPAPATDPWSIVRYLSSDALEGRAPGTPGSAKARAAIVAELKRCGVTPAIGVSFEQPTDGPAINLIGHLPGRDPARHVLLSAHYDHLGIHGGEIMNGADDNAAAVGSVLAVACELARSGPRAATVIVALWDAEEPPHFLTDRMGSRWFVAHPHVPLSSIEAAVVLDLVGAGLWPGSPLHFALGAETSPALARAVDATPPDGFTLVQAGLHLVEDLVTGGHQPWSDYDAFRDAEVPVLFLSNGQTAHYHQPSDDFATLDLPKLSAQTRGLAALVARLADLPASDAPRFSPFERPEVDRAAARQLVAGALSADRGEARDALEADLVGLPTADRLALRAAVQRVQCLAAGHYPTSLCRTLGARR